MAAAYFSSVHSFDHGPDQLFHVLLPGLAGRKDLLVVCNLLVIVAGDANVADEGQSKYTHAAVPSHDHFVRRAHPTGVSPAGSEHVNLGDGLEVGATEHAVDTFTEIRPHAQFFVADFFG